MFEPNYIREIETQLESLDPLLGRGVRILTPHSQYVKPELSDYVFSQFPPDCIGGFTSPILDVQVANSLPYSRPASERFCAIWLHSETANCGHARALATGLHEAAHYIEFGGPGRDGPAGSREAWNGYLAFGKDYDVHGPRWQRVTAHLWYRALAAGYAVDADSVAFIDEHRRGIVSMQSKYRSEIVRGVGRSIESIIGPLATTPAKRRPKAKSSKRTASKANTKPTARAKTATTSGEPFLQYLGGTFLNCYFDGSVETLPTTCGHKPKRYSSFEEYRRAMARRRAVRLKAAGL